MNRNSSANFASAKYKSHATVVKKSEWQREVQSSDGIKLWYKINHDSKLLKILSQSSSPSPYYNKGASEQSKQSEQSEQSEQSKHSEKKRYNLLKVFKHHDKSYLQRLYNIFKMPIWKNTKAIQMLIQKLEECLYNELDDFSIYRILRQLVVDTNITSEISMVDGCSGNKARNLLKNLHLNLSHINRYLDFGCANGNITLAVAKELNLNPQNVYGVDIKKYSNLVLPDNQFAIVQNGKIPFPKTHFNLITCLMVLHHIPCRSKFDANVHKTSSYGIEEILNELYHSMAPDGKLIIKEHDAQKSKEDDPEHYELLKIVLDAQHDFYDYIWQNEGWNMTGIPDTTYLTCNEWDKIIERLGFVLDPATPPRCRQPFSDIEKNPANKFTRMYYKPHFKQYDAQSIPQITPIVWQHINCPNKKYLNLFRIITDQVPRAEYMHKGGGERDESIPTYHWGQKKLFFSEVELLLEYFEKYAHPQKIPTVVYAGSAPGTHIIKLAEMFPTVEFYLYDPRPFNKWLKQMPKMHTYEQYFTNETAKEWCSSNPEHANKDIIFVSDIRTADNKSMSMQQVEKRVMSDNDWQKQWYRIMQPVLTLLKFRLPWDNEKTLYPQGKIYIQIYPGQTSSETRLFLEKDAPDILYDNRKHEQQLYYYNRYLRVSMYHNPLCGMPLEYRKKNPGKWEGMDDRYDSATEAYLLERYLKYSMLCNSCFAGIITANQVFNLHKIIDRTLGGAAPLEISSE